MAEQDVYSQVVDQIDILTIRLTKMEAAFKALDAKVSTPNKTCYSQTLLIANVALSKLPKRLSVEITRLRPSRWT